MPIDPIGIAAALQVMEQQRRYADDVARQKYLNWLQEQQLSLQGMQFGPVTLGPILRSLGLEVPEDFAVPRELAGPMFTRLTEPVKPQPSTFKFRYQDVFGVTPPEGQGEVIDLSPEGFYQATGGQQRAATATYTLKKAQWADADFESTVRERLSRTGLNQAQTQDIIAKIQPTVDRLLADAREANARAQVSEQTLPKLLERYDAEIDGMVARGEVDQATAAEIRTLLPAKLQQILAGTALTLAQTDTEAVRKQVFASQVSVNESQAAANLAAAGLDSQRANQIAALLPGQLTLQHADLAKVLSDARLNNVTSDQKEALFPLVRQELSAKVDRALSEAGLAGVELEKARATFQTYVDQQAQNLVNSIAQGKLIEASAAEAEARTQRILKEVGWFDRRMAAEMDTALMDLGVKAATRDKILADIQNASKQTDALVTESLSRAGLNQWQVEQGRQLLLPTIERILADAASLNARTETENVLRGANLGQVKATTAKLLSAVGVDQATAQRIVEMLPWDVAKAQADVSLTTAQTETETVRREQIAREVKWFDAQAAADLDLKLAQKGVAEATRSQILAEIDNAKRRVDAYVLVAVSEATRNDAQTQQILKTLGPTIDRIVAETANLNSDTATDEATRRAKIDGLKAQAQAALASAGLDRATTQKVLALIPWDVARSKAEVGLTVARTETEEARAQEIRQKVKWIDAEAAARIDLMLAQKGVEQARRDQIISDIEVAKRRAEAYVTEALSAAARNTAEADKIWQTLGPSIDNLIAETARINSETYTNDATRQAKVGALKAQAQRDLSAAGLDDATVQRVLGLLPWDIARAEAEVGLTKAQTVETTQRAALVGKQVQYFDAEVASKLALELSQKGLNDARTQQVLAQIDDAKRRLDVDIREAISRTARNEWEIEQGRAILGPTIDRIMAEVANTNADTATDEATRQARLGHLQAQAKASLASAGVDEATAQRILALVPWDVAKAEAEVGLTKGQTAETARRTELLGKDIAWYDAKVSAQITAWADAGALDKARAQQIAQTTESIIQKNLAEASLATSQAATDEATRQAKVREIVAGTQRQLEQAGLSAAQAKQITEMLPWDVAGAKAEVAYTEARTATEKTRAELLAKDLQWYDKTAGAELANALKDLDVKDASISEALMRVDRGYKLLEDELRTSAVGREKTSAEADQIRQTTGSIISRNLAEAARASAQAATEEATRPYAVEQARQKVEQIKADTIAALEQAGVSRATAEKITAMLPWDIAQAKADVTLTTARATVQDLTAKILGKDLEWYDQRAAADLRAKLAQAGVDEARQQQVVMEAATGYRKAEAQIQAWLSGAGLDEAQAWQIRQVTGSVVQRNLADAALANSQATTDEETRAAKVAEIKARTEQQLQAAGLDAAQARKIAEMLPWDVATAKQEYQAEFSAVDTSGFEDLLPGITKALGSQASWKQIQDYALWQGKAADVQARLEAAKTERATADMKAQEAAFMNEEIDTSPFEKYVPGITTFAPKMTRRNLEWFLDQAVKGEDLEKARAEAGLTRERTETEQLQQQELQVQIQFLRDTYKDRVAEAAAEAKNAEAELGIEQAKLDLARQELAVAKKVGPTEEREAQLRVAELEQAVRERQARIAQINQYVQESKAREANAEQDTKLIAERIKQMQREGQLPGGLSEKDLIGFIISMYGEVAQAAALTFKTVDPLEWLSKNAPAIVDRLKKLPAGAPAPATPVTKATSVIFPDVTKATAEADALIKKYGSAAAALKELESVPLSELTKMGYTAAFVEQVKTILKGKIKK